MKRLLLSFSVLFACGTEEPPAPPVVEKTTLRVVPRADLTSVDLVLDATATISALQLTLRYEPDAGGFALGPASLGSASNSLGLVFDDASRNPGELVIGLADLNRNPLPRSGAIAQVALQNAVSGKEIVPIAATALDLFGNVVEVELVGATLP